MAHDGWRPTTLGDEVELLTGHPFKSNHYTDDPSGIKLLRGDNVVQGRLRWENVKRWPGGKVDDLNQYFLDEGDVVLAMDRPWIEAGLKYAAIDKHDLPALLVQRVARLRGGPTLDTRFLRYLIGSADFTHHVLAVQTGTAVPHISGTQIKSFKFRRPPLSEQRTIADILGSLDDKIELNRRMNETLEAMARAIFKSWFIDFDPVRAKVDGNPPPGLDPATAALFPDTFQDSPLGPIPQGWRVEPLSDHVEAMKGLSYKGKFLSNVGMPLHNLNSVLEGGGYKYEGLKRYTGEYKERHIVHPGDLIVTNTEQGFEYLLIGYAAIVPKRFGDKGLFSHHLYRVRPLPESHITPQFLYLLFRSQRMHDLIAGYTNGTTVNMLPADGLQRPEFVVPPPPLIDRFQEQVGPMLEKIEQLYDENVTLAKTRDVLLPKLLSGELPVGPTTDVVGGVAS